jgi:hypothetical protein
VSVLNWPGLVPSWMIHGLVGSKARPRPPSCSAVLKPFLSGSFPQRAVFFVARADARLAKDNFDGALAGYDEAIRLTNATRPRDGKKRCRMIPGSKSSIRTLSDEAMPSFPPGFPVSDVKQTPNKDW